MVIGCIFICVFAVLINKVSLQERVEAVIGGSVLLPCSSTEHDLKLQDTDVHWRHNGSKLVYDIVKGKDSLQLQDPDYKNRAETFPDEYERGNFSIKLIHLQYADEGQYICILTHSSELQTLQLIITAGKESKSTEHENPENETASDSVETSSILFTILLILLIISILSMICCLIAFYYRRKKQQTPSFSFVRTED